MEIIERPDFEVSRSKLFDLKEEELLILFYYYYCIFKSLVYDLEM